MTMVETVESVIAAIPKVDTTGLDEGFDRTIRTVPEHLLGAPDHDFLDPAFSADPFTPLAALRSRSGSVVRRAEDGLYGGQPIFNLWGHNLDYPHFVVIGHAAATEIGTDRERFINAGAYGAHEAAQGRTVNTFDGNDHRSLRRLFDNAIFGRRAIMEWTEQVTGPTIRYLVQRLRDMLAAGETPDLRRDFALPLTYKSISAIIGVPQQDLAYFVELGEKAQGAPRDMEASLRAVAEMDHYFERQLAARRLEPKADMLTIMSNAEEKGRRMSDEEIVQHCRFLLPGGIETTWRQTANLLMAMLLHPDQFGAVVADRSLVDRAVEESLRWAPSGFVVPRRAAVDTEVAGVPIPAGSSICTIQGACNRDPAVFSKPDRFDIHRHPNPHLTFHTGVHFCMGQNLARYTLRMSLATIAAELPGLTLACAPEEIGMQGFGVRNPTRLPVAL